MSLKVKVETENLNIAQVIDRMAPDIVRKLVKPDLDKLSADVQNAKDEIAKQIQTDKATLITIFGIFASITSFLTIEFQFLKTVCCLEKIVGFSLVLFALLFGFNIALDYLIKSRLDKDTPRPHKYFIALTVVLFCIGIFFIYIGNEEKYRDNHIYQRYSDDFENKSTDFRKQYDQKLKELDSQIQKLKETT
jgi:hypothetical protein